MRVEGSVKRSVQIFSGVTPVTRGKLNQDAVKYRASDHAEFECERSLVVSKRGKLRCQNTPQIFLCSDGDIVIPFDGNFFFLFLIYGVSDMSAPFYDAGYSFSQKI